jgi:vacuolar-type H+-ATPase subunit F/Vma7
MLPEHVRDAAVRSVKPVVVVVSDEPQEELRAMIIRSIGVDLLKG